MYVCLCNGITSQTVQAVVAEGARTSNQVAAACGAGRDCARCRRTVQAIIAVESVTVRAADTPTPLA
ncbi:(2Fe-2S)-binding protein [Mycobacterium sp. M1]|uniref:Bacterioferritin-associated ferredoxin n=1 Tax=Mycolicibacter acidiphilus TaxID=2835306 RepID=A0ABS5REK6_9MYCO|nr:(2Fe-2S)-binding protein [Mycolicibacter acidiphilus]MBS9532723.1 (2Fe-2S)-binding protein [Mycolicibacter acidiphilus]